MNSCFLCIDFIYNNNIMSHILSQNFQEETLFVLESMPSLQCNHAMSCNN